MTSDTDIRFDTGGRYTRDDLGLSPTQWSELQTLVNDIELAIDSSDNPPRIVGNEVFHPGQWVGNYDDLVTIVPRKVTTDQYERMVDEVAGFVSLFPGPIGDVILPEMPELTVEGKAAYPRYSHMLLAYTEELLAGRLPVQVYREASRGFEFDGSPDIKRVIRERASNSPMVVSRKTQFTFDTPANHLLYRFHRRLATHLDDLLDKHSHLPDRISKQRQYHIDFIENTIPTEVTDSNANPTLMDPSVLMRIRSQSSGVIMEIVDLWEAYLHQRAQLDPFSSFVTAIKPIYEVFELWCLSKVLNILEDEYGPWTPNREPSAASQFLFDDVDATLYYDTSVSAQSRYVAADDAFAKRESGHPDFLLVVNDEIRWLADAKFQNIEALDISGIQRFLGYLIDFVDLGMEETPPTALLGVGSGSANDSFSVEGVQVHQESVMTAEEIDEGGLAAVRAMISGD